MLAMVNCVDDLPVTFQGDDDQACRSSVQTNCNQSGAVPENTQSHRTRTWVAVVVEHSRNVHCISHGYHHTGDQLKGRIWKKGYIEQAYLRKSNLWFKSRNRSWRYIDSSRVVWLTIRGLLEVSFDRSQSQNPARTSPLVTVPRYPKKARAVLNGTNKPSFMKGDSDDVIMALVS